MIYTLYFAYGSNMNAVRFRERCPSSAPLCRAVLRDHRFIITKRGYANIVPAPRQTVHGLLCALTSEDEKVLDRCEGVPTYYKKHNLTVQTDGGYTLNALVYIDSVVDPGTPKAGYLEIILAGARHHQLPDSAIKEIESWRCST